MARAVASGGLLLHSSEIEAAVAADERLAAWRKREQGKERGKKFWGGCLKGVLWFFGMIMAIGLLGNLLRACTGGGQCLVIPGLAGVRNLGGRRTPRVCPWVPDRASRVRNDGTLCSENEAHEPSPSFGRERAGEGGAPAARHCCGATFQNSAPHPHLASPANAGEGRRSVNVSQPASLAAGGACLRRAPSADLAATVRRPPCVLFALHLP